MIIIVFPSFVNYPERLKMYIKMSEIKGVDEIIIYTREVPDSFKNTKRENVSINIIRDKKNFYLGLRKIIKNKIKDRKDIIIVNHFINITPFSKRYRRNKNLKVITKIYFPNFLIFFKKNQKIQFNLNQKLLFIKRGILDIYSIIFSDIVAGNSEEIEELTKKVANVFRIKRKILTLLTPVDTEFYSFKDREYNKKVINLLFVGNLLKRKGIYDVFEILKMLKKDNIEFNCYFAGRFVYKEDKIKIERIINKNNLEDNVHFIGYLNKFELRDYYQKSDLLLLPSYYEGSPRVVKEAMACGLPVISYNIKGIQLIDNGTNVIQTVEIGDKKQLLKKIKELIYDREKMKTISLKGRKHMENYFSIDKIAKKTVVLFKKMLGESVG